MNASDRTKLLFLESCRTNNYSSFVYTDLCKVIDKQSIPDSFNPGYAMRRSAEHLMKSIMLMCAYMEHEGVSKEEAKVAKELIYKMRPLVHDAYRAYMAPVMQGWQAMLEFQKKAEAGIGLRKLKSVSEHLAQSRLDNPLEDATTEYL